MLRISLPTILVCLTLSSFKAAGLSISESSGRPVLKYGISPSASMIPWDADPKTGTPGIYREIVFLILAESNIAGEARLLPTKHAIKALEEGEIDFDFVNPSWFTGGKVGAMFVSSAPILSITEWLITLPENVKGFDDVQKVYGNLVGTIRGYYYYNDDRFTRLDFDSERALIGGLKRKRFKVAILEEMSTLYWSKETAINVALSAVYTDGHVVLRLHKNKAHLLPVLNSAIYNIQKQGKIEETLERYRKFYGFVEK